MSRVNKRRGSNSVRCRLQTLPAGQLVCFKHAKFQSVVSEKGRGCDFTQILVGSLFGLNETPLGL